MFIRKLTIEHVCHSERSEESLILTGPVVHKNKPRCFASLNMTLAIYRCPDGQRDGQSGIARATRLSNDFSFSNWLGCGNRADYRGSHENLAENLYSS